MRIRRLELAEARYYATRQSISALIEPRDPFLQHRFLDAAVPPPGLQYFSQSPRPCSHRALAVTAPLQSPRSCTASPSRYTPATKCSCQCRTKFR